MKLTSQKRPSPAMVVAVIALALGLAGSAVAGKTGLGKAKVKTIVGQEITNRAPDLAVASAKKAETAETAKSADTAEVADMAKSADTATSADSAKRADSANAVAPNAVNGAGIADGSVGDADLANNSINGAKVVDESIAFADLADDSVHSDEIARDAVGPEEIVLSAVGAYELKDADAVISQGVTVAPGSAGTTVATCPGGTRLMAGGHAWTVDGLNSIIVSAPDETSTTRNWVVRGYVPAGAPTNNLFAWATCLDG